MGVRMNSAQFLYQKEAPWFPMTIDEVTTFPEGTHDDMVDALAYLSHVSSQYAMSASPTMFGSVTLDQVTKARQQSPEQDEKVLYASLRVQKMEKDRQRSLADGGMGLHKMRGPT